MTTQIWTFFVGLHDPHPKKNPKLTELVNFFMIKNELFSYITQSMNCINHIL